MADSPECSACRETGDSEPRWTITKRTDADWAVRIEGPDTEGEIVVSAFALEAAIEDRVIVASLLDVANEATLKQSARAGSAEARLSEAVEALERVEAERDRWRAGSERVWAEKRDRECLCSKSADGQWITPPSCPFHGVRHLRERNADRIQVTPQDIYGDLEQAEARLREAVEALEEIERRCEAAGLWGLIGVPRNALNSLSPDRAGEGRGR